MTERLDGPDEGTAERLLDEAAQGHAPSPDPLATLLAAARATDTGEPLVGEGAAVAAFRAARPPAPAPGQAPIVRRRLIRLAAAAALATASLAGVAYGAQRAGVPLPFFPPGKNATVPASPNPQTTPSPAATPGAPAVGATPGNLAAPSGRSRPSASAADPDHTPNSQARGAAGHPPDSGRHRGQDRHKGQDTHPAGAPKPSSTGLPPSRA